MKILSLVILSISLAACGPQASDGNASLQKERVPEQQNPAAMQISKQDLAAVVACLVNEQKRDVSSVTSDDVAKALLHLQKSPDEATSCRRKLVVADGSAR